MPSRSSGTKPTPASNALRASPFASARACDRDRAARARPQPGDRLAQLALPVAGHAGDGDDLTRRHGEARPLHRGQAAVAVDPEPFDLEHRLAPGAVRAGRRARRSSTSWPTISAASEAGVAPAAGAVAMQPAAPQHGDAVGDRHHLVQLVRDEDDRPALCRHLAQRLEERVRLLGREHRGRLVEDQDPRVLVERLEDLDALALADRELPDPRMRVDRQAVALGELADLPLDRSRVDDEMAADAARVAEDDVLGDREALDQAELLVHHADAGVDRLPRRGEAHRLAPQHDLALVRRGRGR